MSVDKAELCDSLLLWIQTFHVSSPCTTKQHLTSGVVIAQVLNHIDPAWFNEAWLGRIKEDINDWRLKVSNLKKILQSMLEYYHDVLGHQISEYNLPEVNLIGEHSDAAELGRLLQLVLGCAVSCEKKQEYIQHIMTLEESVQHVVMTAIQELLTKDPCESVASDNYSEVDCQLKRFSLCEEVESGDELSQRCHELDLQVATLLEEKNSLLAENKLLREGMSRSNSLEDSTSATNKKLLLLQSQLELVQEENYRLEAIKDDFRIRCEEMEKESSELHHRNDELTSLAEESQSLKDEMDILRHSSDKVSKLEATVEAYKRKLEDLGDLRRQVKLLEERNTVYMQKTFDLEEELKKANSVRSQLEVYKRQVHELHNKHTEESMKTEKWQFEFKHLQEKHDALLKEKERLIVERDGLRETNEELRCAQAQQKVLSKAASNEDLSVGNLAAEMVPAELQERVIRLQHENKMLRVQQEETYHDRFHEFQNVLDDANRHTHKLENENRLNQQQITELRSQVEQLQRALQEQGSKAEDSNLLKRKLDEHLEKLHEAHTELQKKREYIDDLEPTVDSYTAHKIDELQEVLKKKDEDMKAMEERYKKYLDKARTVIRTLDPKQTPTTAPEVQALKNQLHEKEAKIHLLEGNRYSQDVEGQEARRKLGLVLTDFEKNKSQRDQEEKLIISAWYNMGMALHQKVSEERSRGPGQSQSFLAQQRQATNARRSHPRRLQQQSIMR
ncbi:protein Hook homolog 3-like isoform X1 [Leucoraja erinacea]|uniref:protein Hook homolog 3-like isoform X1 n=1 Tax=Leucoraja erinaceus TaxID=7782 RepID=UPI0024575CBA|nr:protein Hook homolog 3-like isoform X1 [Leucoraja erinacea]